MNFNKTFLYGQMNDFFSCFVHLIKRSYILNSVFSILEKIQDFIWSHTAVSLYHLKQSEVIIVGSCETSTTSETEKCLRIMKRIKAFRSTIEIVALTMLITEKSLVNSISHLAR